MKPRLTAANLKAEQIRVWRSEHLGEARFLLTARSAVEDIVAFATASDDAAAPIGDGLARTHQGG